MPPEHILRILKGKIIKTNIENVKWKSLFSDYNELRLNVNQI